MSTSTGAPMALARALGCHEARNGTAANAAPTAPVATVAAVRNLRLLASTFSVIQLSPGESQTNGCPPDGAGIARARRAAAHYRGKRLAVSGRRSVEWFSTAPLAWNPS